MNELDEVSKLMNKELAQPTLEMMRDQRVLMDPYLLWADAEGVPIIEDFGVDLRKVETGRWDRLDADGAFVHLKGRGDFMSMFVIDIPPGASTSEQKHLYEEVVYVLDGHGSTTVELLDGTVHSFEWGPNSIFALPLNARYRHFNGSGAEVARLVSGNNLCLMINLFHDPKFIFDNPGSFPGRFGEADWFDGNGEMIETQPTRFMWVTNFVADVANFKLKSWAKRGGRSSNIRFCLADGVMHTHTSEMAVGTYKKGHRHGPDFHVLVVKGSGHSLLWYEGDEDFVRLDWHPGYVFAPPDQMFHQHFNTSVYPARYVPIACGSTRYPMTKAKRDVTLGVDVSVQQGGCQIEYEDQDPRIHRIFLEELRKNGGESLMGEFLDESPYAELLAAEGK
jgi:mannose-6-phosphate isomerase-like protein (cupin superfamily)